MKIKCEAKKNIKLKLILMLILGLLAIVQPTSLLADEVMVEEKVLIDAPTKAVWALIGGFKAIDRWHPGVVASTLLGTGSEIGDIRVLTLNKELSIVEQLEFYDQNAMTLRYQILESPLPIANYHATLIAKDAAKGMTEIIWNSSFKAVGASDEEAKKIISDIYLAGFESLNDLFN